MDTSVTVFMAGLQFFNSETSAPMFAAELMWFFGGVLSAFALCAFGMIIRGVRAGAGHIDL